ncbi:related to RIM20 - protein involved in proteolytic activation of Rim101p [Pseudozyma flocculosa]|uniref:Related to RIM20 - protein involved in proteolytic activation of Rim101p n=1 Tax=Pseudozyma flocculosa TaxID=84751 RepID=A0A5C3F6J5_9BASI|nr:related to RIM20 - protein involved in proteolytic activation of Rim101p [Pseudozyma flocculosa]
MPRNILAVPAKRTPSLGAALAQAIRTYIAQSYADTHPDAFARDVRELCRLRDECCRLAVHVTSIDVALRYHAQLVFFSTKFPPDIGISFPWSVCFPSQLPSWTSGVAGAFHDAAADQGPGTASAYATADTVAHPDVVYERANVLYSLASLYSALGTAEGRGDVESIKRATAWFQHAAGVFDHIREALLPEIRHLKPQSPDFSPNLLESLRDLMLAQAQECFWQKAVLDRLKDGTIAKLAERVSELYASALDRASSSATGLDLADDAADVTTAQLPADWVSHVSVKRWHFAAASQYRKACEDLGANRYGDELGRLKVAEGHVKRALDSSKRGVSEAIVQDLRSLQQVIQTNIQRGTKDNDLIYLEPVTPASNLAPIPAASMVKPVLPNEVANAISLLRDSPAPALGKPLFAELVPYGVHLAISIYDDRRDSLVREQIAERRDELDSIAQSTLQSLNLPGSLQALEQPMGLPPSLLRRHEEVVSKGGIDRLYSIADDIAQISRADADTLSEAFSILEQEQREDEHVRRLFSQHKWPRPPSHEAAAQLRQTGESYAQSLEQARASDAIIRQKLEDWSELIGVLSSGVDALEAFVPSTSSSSSNNSQSDAQVSAVRGLRTELETLDDLFDARAACLAECKSLASGDDIRPAVLRETARLSSTTSKSIDAAMFEDLFESEMAKYDRFRDEMAKSAQDQEALLDSIKKRNDEFLEARKVDITIKRRTKALQNLDVAYAKYRELDSNLVEGLEFYNGLAKLLSAYRQDVKIDVQDLVSKFGGTSLSPRASHAPSSAPALHANADADVAAAASPRARQRKPAAAAAADSPRRSTRRTAAAKKKDEVAEVEQDEGRRRREEDEEAARQQQAQPQWGAFPGGEIRFGN